MNIDSLVEGEGPGLRRTTRSTAGRVPDRHGNGVTTEKRRRTKSTIAPASKSPKQPSSTPPNTSKTSKQNSIKSFCTNASKSSFRTTVSSSRRRSLEADLRSEERMNKLADEADKLKIALAQLNAKLEKNKREKVIAEKSHLLEKSKIEELENDDNDSQYLSTDSEYDEDADSDYVPPKLESMWGKNIDIIPTFKPSKPPVTRMSDQFQEFSKCIADAIIQAGSGSSQASERRGDSEMQKFVARQSGAKELPYFGGVAEEWPAFINAYQRSTKTCKFSNDENLIRLQKALKGKAKESVQGLLISPENIPQILRVLETRFGNPSHIIETLENKVKSFLNVRDDKPENLMEFTIAVENLVATVESLQRPQYLLNPVLLKELVQKIPFHLRIGWGKKMSELEIQEPNIKDFSTWLTKKSSALSIAGVKVTDFEKIEKPRNKFKKETVMTTVTFSKKCTLCNRPNHSSLDCNSFKLKTVDNRWKLVKEKRVCFCCLQNGHSSRDCPKRTECGENGCPLPHHKLLHNPRPAPKKEEVKVMISRINSNPKVMIKILPIVLRGPKGEVKTHAMLDDGATASLLDANVAAQLGLTGPNETLNISNSGFENQVDHSSRKVELEIRGTNTEHFLMNEVRTVQNFNWPIQTINAKHLKQKWCHLRNVQFESFVQARPSILIGERHVHLTASREIIEGNIGGPMLSFTKLGWVVHGNNSTPEPERVMMISVGQTEDEKLHQLVKSHFTLESFGVKLLADKVKSREEERADEIMKKTVRKVGNRYETGLLWKTDNVQLPRSKSNALRKLKMVEKKLDADPIFASKFCEKMEDNMNKGYARKLSLEEIAIENGKTNYLSFFDVVNPNKPGKMRIVFNAAAKNDGLSLNDHLLTGPDLYNSLPGNLCKFREKRFPLMGDIREMFPQVKIRPEDSVAQRFYWRGMSRDKEPEVYEMTSMIFGAVCSPALAQYVKNLNAENFKEEHPKAYDAIVNRHYMDDYLDSCHTIPEAVKLAKDVIKIHREGGFEIVNWMSSKEILREIPEDMRASKIENMEISDLPNERVLGLQWNPTNDEFFFNIKFHKVNDDVLSQKRTPTKREMLQLVMSMFDPLGFLSHYVIQAKILLQDVWRESIGWDEEISSNLLPLWNQWLSGLALLPDIRIPRWYKIHPEFFNAAELHVFTDASEQAYSAVAYIRFPHDEKNFSLAFVFGKARVTPTKSVSIPRLELQAAVMGTRIAKTIIDEHEMKFTKVQFWTDSTTVLHWLRSDSRRFKTFVANRVGEIEETTDCSQWRWVPTKENPADDATRNVNPADLTTHCRWLCGPAFVKEEESSWPLENWKKCDSQLDVELKKDVVFVSICIDSCCPYPPLTKFSNWMKLLRSTAWMLRFINRTLKKTDVIGELNPDEIKEAETRWMKLIQYQSFKTEIDCLKGEQEIPKGSRLVTLTPFLDQNGILRVKSRISNNDDLPYSTKFPAILDPKSEYTKRLILWHNVKIGHHGQELLVNELRKKYCILNVRTAARSSWNKCQVCQNYRAQPHPPLMADLPDMRVTKLQFAFTHTGLDGFGPFEIKNGRKHEKRYGLIFTCLSTRAVHLEVLQNLSTDSAILAIRRLISLRGKPASFYSDNGTNFKGAERELREAMQQIDYEKIKRELTTVGTSWTFIPPRAPHMGGAWERLVQSVKIAIYSTLNERCPTEEVLRTLFCEAANIVNCRPLTHVSIDPNDEEPLTPNHFLLTTSNTNTTPGDFSDEDQYLRRQWKFTQRLINVFWRRWTHEYIPMLLKRPKWNRKQRPIQIEDVVLVTEENAPRNSWTKGLVVKVYPGKDGRIRVADVKTSSGIFRRPVAKLCVLQVRPESENSEESH